MVAKKRREGFALPSQALQSVQREIVLEDHRRNCLFYDSEHDWCQMIRGNITGRTLCFVVSDI